VDPRDRRLIGDTAVIAFNFRTQAEDTAPDGFAGLDANQVAVYLPPSANAPLVYAQYLRDGLTPLDAWLGVTEAALHLNIQHHNA
jgi:hypothetical protein